MIVILDTIMHKKQRTSNENVITKFVSSLHQKSTLESRESNNATI